MAQRYFSVHGHFYQPPRDDPFSGEIPQEVGAHPFNNWNEKILSQCYQPNAELGNFLRISFDFGPSLFGWMEKHHPQTYHTILSQEKQVYKKYGVSNAMAHPYHHVILPLVGTRDKITQVKWGIHDYQLRFGHPPQGMWLPETAVDFDTMQVLSENDIDFTILAPWQTYQQPMDISHPYRVNLAHGKSLTIFFSEGYLSHDLSFNPPASEDADRFVEHSLLPAFHFLQRNHQHADLIMVASDGELYGHHQPEREYFLQRLFTFSLLHNDVQSTFPALWLQENEPAQSVAVRENTSWSCHHGIERWRTTCPDGPDSTWKAPLLKGFQQLAEMIDISFEENAQALGIDAWQMRDDYSQVLLGVEPVDAFIQQHSPKELSTQEKNRIALLLQAQCERLRMFTSDVWFFENLDRIESRNGLMYAAHAAHLCKTANRWEDEHFAEVVNTLSGAQDQENQFNTAEFFKKLLHSAAKPR